VGNNSPIQDGLRTMTVNAADLAGTSLLALSSAKTIINFSEFTRNNSSGFFPENAGAASVGFVVDHTPPAVSLDDGRIVRGDINYVRQINGPDFRFVFFDEVSGLKSMALSGPNSQAIPLDGHEFSSSASLADGNYTLTVEDKAGNKTIVRFAVYSLRVYLSTTTSRANLDRDADSFSAQIDIAASGSNSLGNITLIDSDFEPVDSKPVLGNSTPVTFSLTGKISEYKAAPKTFYAYVLDSAGNYRYMTFNLLFSRAGNYKISLPVTKKDAYVSPVLDMADAAQAFIPGGVMSIYPKTQAAQETLPEWWWTGGNGFYTTHVYPEEQRELNLAQIKTVNLPLGPIQKFGHVKTMVHTWNNQDKTDSTTYTVAERNMYFVDNNTVPPGTTCGNSLEEYPSTQNYPTAVCYAETASSYTYINTKRYVQAEVVLTKLEPAMAASCLAVSMSDPSRCLQIYDPEPGVLAAGPELYGLAVQSVELAGISGVPFTKGELVTLNLPGIGSLTLNNVAEGGVLQYGPAYTANYPGTFNLLGNLSFGFDVVNGRFSGARLETGYDATGLTPAQEALIRAYKIKNDGTYVLLPSMVSALTKKVSCDTDSFSRIMFSVPAYTNPTVIQGAVMVGSSPEMEFVSVDTSAAQALYNTATQDGQVLLSSISAAGLIPAGNIYQLGPEELDLSQPGTIVMRYDIASLAAAGLHADTLGIYGLSEDGSVIHRLPGQIPNKVSGSITAEVGMLYPLYAILAGTGTLVGGDVTPPVTALNIAGSQYLSDNTSYISGGSSVTLAATDPEVLGAGTSGVSTVYYLVDIPTNTLTKSVYQQPFMLSGGIHNVHYQALDATGNLEAFNTRLLYVDAAAPEAQVSVSSGALTSGGYAITENDHISIIAGDVTDNNVRSGLKVVYYLVDVSPEACGNIENVVPAAPGGTCLNPIYSSPFTIGPGTHTVYYTAVDNVGNMAALKNAAFVVSAVNSSLDITPPVLTMRVNGQDLPDGGMVNVASTDTFALSAIDEGSGLESVYYAVDMALSTATATVYVAPFALGGGTHTIYCTAFDKAGNQAPVKSAIVVAIKSVYSSVAVAGVPELVFSAPVAGVTMAMVEAGSSEGAAALAEASSINLKLVSNLYELGPDGAYPQSSAVVFSYSPAALPVGISESDIAVYEHFAEGVWVKVPGQTINAESHQITAPVTQIASLFAIFGLETTPVQEVNTSAGLSVNFNPSYTSIAAQTQVTAAGLTVSFTPDYQAIVPSLSKVSAGISVAFVPQGYLPVYENQSADGVVSIINQNVMVTAENVSQEGSGVALALAAASGAELVPVGGLYDLGPSGTQFVPAAELVYRYEESQLNGADENALYIYRYDEGAGWQKLDVLERNTAENWISVKTDHLCLLGLFYSSATSPAASLSVNGYVLVSGSEAYITQADSITLGGNALAASLAYTIDADFSPEAAITYTIPFVLSAGTHTVNYTAFDSAENQGELKHAFFTVSSRQAALAITPSSGPIGVPFIIEGAGFGTYVAGTTVVLLGGATAPLTLWTDTKIQGTIPGALSAGQYPVSVKRGAAVLAEVSPFTVTQPALYSLTPSSGAIGLPFTITGENFGNYVAGFTRVMLGGATMPLTLWTDTKIQGTIPGTLPVGDYELVVERALNGGVVRTSTTTFSLRDMEAYWLAPSSGPIGMPFTITGAGFGNYSSVYTHVLIGGTTAPLTLWTDSKIQGTVPGSLASGQYPVQVERRTSDGGVMQTSPMTFEVVTVYVASMTPVAGPIGLPFTIYGSNFGNYSAGYTKVLIGGTTCPLTLWTDTKIQGTVPGSLAADDYQAIVERTLNGGQVQSTPLAFRVAAPVAYTLAPSSGPIGLPFTITGENFGNYVANYTKVLIGGATAPLTLWSTTSIKGTVPALAAGDYELVVERALNGGVVRTSTFTFTVGTPYLDNVGPSTASVIAPFTITGYNFGNYAANYTKVLVNGTTAPLTLWTDTKIQGKLPFLLAGTYPVQVQRYLNGGLAESATAYINVEEPLISSMTPVSGAAGTIVNLYGTGFGPYDATMAKVFIGGVQCALSLWNNTQIRGTLPSGLSYGTHTVVAMRGQAVSNGLEFYIPGGYNPSMMRRGAVPAALEFKLGEVYVYPDPAKGGKVPVFHIEVGTADSVKIKVFTVAGQLAHEATLTGNPQAVGTAYAYEYAWTGRIASGVYYYTVEAERSGKKLKAKGRFSVVR